MIKDLIIINYFNKIYSLYILEGKLLLKNETTILEINNDVSAYSLDYNNGIIWVVAYNDNGIIFVYKMKTNEKQELCVSTYSTIEYPNIYTAIEYISITVDKNNDKNVIFCGRKEENNKSYLFHAVVNDKTSMNILTSYHSTSNKPYNICKIKDDIYIFICINKQKGDYILYSLLEEGIVSNIVFHNSYNINLINFMDKPTIFYWSGNDKFSEVKYKIIHKNQASCYIEDEKNIGLPGEFNNLYLSNYRGKIYLSLSNSENILIAQSSNLIEWKLFWMENRNNKIKSILMKILDDSCNTLVTTIKAMDINNVPKVDEMEKNIINKNKNTSVEILKREIVRVQMLNSFQNLINIEAYYGRVCNNYLERINNLLKVIEEKDEIILNLLEIK